MDGNPWWVDAGAWLLFLLFAGVALIVVWLALEAVADLWEDRR